MTSRTLAALALSLALPLPARAGDAADPHAHCHAAAQAHALQRATRTTARYTVPAISLVRDDGAAVSLPAELDDGRPVVLDFIFTSCTTICPVMTHVLADVQRKLGPDAARVHIVSISIDPEQDTPARLAAYAREFHAGPGWRWYTGTAAASVAAQRAFDVYRGDKMDHTAVTFIRAAPGQPWVRIDGFASADELAAEVRAVVAAR